MDEGVLRVEPPGGRVVLRPAHSYLLANAALLIVALTVGPLMLLGAAQEASLDFLLRDHGVGSFETARGQRPPSSKEPTPMPGRLAGWGISMSRSGECQ
jgi:hypothetical protein